jgi:autotransporter-associated beta strand protein
MAYGTTDQTRLLTLGGTNTGANTFSKVIANNGSGATTLTKAGAGKWFISSTNTYTGATNVNAGTLAITGSGSINASSGVNVAAGANFVYNSSTTMTNSISLSGAGTSSRAILGGAGTIGATVALNDLGDTLSPGNSPGIQTFTQAQTWSSFSYDWEVNNFTGTTAGTDFDQLGLNTLDLTGGPASYTLNVLSLTASNDAGNVPNFSEVNRSWTILTSSAGITGFNAANWSINTSGFADPTTGNWVIAQSGNDLVLSYNVIPEPNVAALIGGLGVLLILRRRR